MDLNAIMSIDSFGVIRRWTLLGQPQGFPFPRRAFFVTNNCDQTIGGGGSGAAYVFEHELPSTQVFYASATRFTGGIWPA